MPPVRIKHMHVSAETVAAEHQWVRGRADIIVPLINDVRSSLADWFDTTVGEVSDPQYLDAVDEVFADGDVAVNVTALVGLLRDLDVDGDYPGFVVDEFLGRELAGLIAGGDPFRLLGEATFHFADVTAEAGGEGTAGADDLDAALAAGFQTRLPGWSWTAGESPFSVDPSETT